MIMTVCGRVVWCAVDFWGFGFSGLFGGLLGIGLFPGFWSFLVWVGVWGLVRFACWCFYGGICGFRDYCVLLV